MRRVFLLNFIIIFLVAGCELVEYHPNEVIVEKEYRDLNNKNINKIKSKNVTDTIRIALFGDTQRFYEETNEFVQKVNSMPEIDFAVLAGDITDFGLNFEYKWIGDILFGLKVPYLTVIGNHDLVANGEEVYKQMFGPLDYSFDHGGYRFIFLNTNSREFGFNGRVPDLDWLEQSMYSNPSGQKILVFSHIAPYSVDFDSNLEERYASILAREKNVLGSLHAHNHTFEKGEYYDDGVLYYVTTTVSKKSFALVTLTNGNMDIKEIEF